MLRDLFVAIDPAIVVAIVGLLAMPLLAWRFRKAESPSLRKRLIVRAILLAGAALLTCDYVIRYGEWPMPISFLLG